MPQCEGTTIGITDPRVGAGSRRPLPVQAASRHAGDLVVAVRRRGCSSMPASARRTTGGATSSATRIPRATWSACTESCASGCANNGGVAGITYRSQDFAEQLHRRVRVACVGVPTSRARTA